MTATTSRIKTAEEVEFRQRGFFRRLWDRWPVKLVVIIIVFVWLVPTIGLLVSSFREPNLVSTTGWWTAIPNLFDSGQWTLENYKNVLESEGFGNAFLNSIAVAVPATVIPITIAAFAAYAFSWMEFRGRQIMFVVVVGLLVVPLQMALIPILSEYLATRGRPEAWKLFSRIANLAFVVTAFAAILIAIFADQIVRSEIGIAPGFGVAEQDVIIKLMRLNLIATTIFSVSGLVMGGLQANQHFFLPAMAPMLYNVGQIFGALVFSPSEPYSIAGITFPAMGLGVHGLVYGVILGAVLHLGIQIPGLIKYKFRWTPSITLKDEGVIKALKIMGPRLITMIGIQLVFIARDNFASRLEVGAITALTYGWMIMQVPATLVGTAIATAILPTLSEYAATDNWTKFRETVEKAIRVLVGLTLPIAAILSAGLLPLVRLVFGFDVDGTALLTWTTRAYLLTLVGYSIQEILSRAFYARKEALVPLATIFVRFGIYI